MPGFLHPESDFMEKLHGFTDLMILNLLFILTSIPVVTLGASMSALYSVALDLAKKEEGPIIRSYFSAFFRHFKKGSLLVLPLFFLGLLLFSSTTVVFLWPVPFRRVLLMVQGGLILIYILLTALSFGFLAKEGLGVKETFVLAASAMGKRLPEALLVGLMHLLPVVATALLAPLSPQVLMIWAFVGFSLVAYGSAHLIHRMLDKGPLIRNPQTSIEENA